MVGVISLTILVNLLLLGNAAFLLWPVTLEIAMGIIVKSLGSDLLSIPRLL